MEHIFGKENRSYWMGFSILIIFCYHLLYPEWNGFTYKILKSIFARAEIGVDIFFFVSVYGLCHSYTHKKLLGFYKSRFNRLFPIYPFFMLCFCTHLGYSFQESIIVFIQQITGFACIIKKNFEWYIPALILIYAFFPLIFQGIKWLIEKHFKWSYYLILLFSIGLGTLCFQQIFRIHLAKRLPIIVLGIMTFFCEQKNKEKEIIGLYAIAALGSFFSTWYGYVPIVLYSLKYLPRTKIANKTICFLGKHSLEIYLGQHIAYRCYYNKPTIDLGERIIIVIFVTVFYSIILGFVQHYFWKLIANTKK